MSSSTLSNENAYSDLVVKSGLADYSAVRGCMIIKPYGFSLWENMRSILDARFKETGHVNAYFPIFIPKRFLSREAAHIEGFAKECAVVTHYRLKNDTQGVLKVDEDAKLEEELIVRPTSETIIWSTYKEWIQSYKDLPLLINQWANVVRWEMRTRLFLRTTEFLWQEGHTAHATQEEAIIEAEKMLNIYADFIENYMAIPVVRGKKTPSERFAGAEETYCVEVMLKDGKALQAGTAHFLGQNFAKAFDVTFLDKNNQKQLVWATSWGVSTRLIGALIMAHSDEKGLMLPPKIAPIQVILIPIGKMDALLSSAIENIHLTLQQNGIRVQKDISDARPGWKFAEYELRGIPIRISIGQRELADHKVEVVRRDTAEKIMLPLENLATTITDLLNTIQNNMLHINRTFLKNHITEVNSIDAMESILTEKGGFVSAHWDGTNDTENRIKERTKATIRCIPLDEKLQEKKVAGKCILTGNPSQGRVLFAKAY